MAANTTTTSSKSAGASGPSAPIAIPSSRSTESSAMLSSSIPTSSSTDERSVRFEDACVLIPDTTPSRSRGPRMVSRTYTLPRFKKRRSSSLDGPTSPEDEQRLQFRVALPSFLGSPKASSSAGPSSSAHGSGASSLPHHQTLTPCLVHRTPAFASALSSEPESAVADEPLSPASPQDQQEQIQRSPRVDTVPASPRASFSGFTLATIPLRDCCPDCGAATDAALAQGPAWDAPFTRGAARLRSLSASATEGLSPSSAGATRSGRGATFPFRPHAVRCVSGSAAAAALGADKVCAINVDEVDMRRGGPSPLNADVGADSDAQATDTEVTDAESPAINFADPPKRPWCKSAGSSSSRDGRPHSAIPEEEDELFPLPSPRRSPSGSPLASPAGSSSCLSIPSSTAAVEGPPTRRSPSNSSAESLPVASPNPRHIQTQTPLGASPAAAARPRWLAPPGANGSSSSLASRGTFRSSSPNLLGGMPSISGRSTPTTSSDPLSSASASASSESSCASEAPRAPSPAPSDVSASPTLCDALAQPQPQRPGMTRSGSATPTRAYTPNAAPIFPAGHSPRNLAPPVTRRRPSPAASAENVSLNSSGRASPLPGNLSGRVTIRSTTTIPERSASSPGLNVELGEGGSRRGSLSLVSPSLPDIASMAKFMSLNDDADRVPPPTKSPVLSPLSQSHLTPLSLSPSPSQSQGRTGQLRPVQISTSNLSSSSAFASPSSPSAAPQRPSQRAESQTALSASPTQLRAPPSPTLTRSPSTKKRASFNIAKPRGIIADVLRGVGAIGGGGGGGGSAVGVGM
ncbi:hypothetical protein CONPUDRAFT_78584 [Coniophora puteana RWD-64-598 SS2]|uniref:Uncharacterized protein n=1 Tax=Coniophora puteana (strain RWD-64-598) TaxID=741705 RepID=A0A5M3N3M1_CONPW|nr:uncharacterized protein CONPUDRAFT_78584 [Coniophora puteana RWD-64-598 SS2]EIW86019.1 hypothetical protein CONPUDRAFT_78584 [Coniophora puteana RWD-64-598 SS2]